MTLLRVGDQVPNIELVDPDGSPWPLRAQVGEQPLVLILHRHLA